MKKPVNDLVDKLWAAKMKLLLKGNSPEMNTMLTRLLTKHQEHLQDMKTKAARDRFTVGLKYLTDAIKLGWHSGIQKQEPKFTLLPPGKNLRRIRPLARLAVLCGARIGLSQAKALDHAHRSSGLAVTGVSPDQPHKDDKPTSYVSAV